MSEDEFVALGSNISNYVVYNPAFLFVYYENTNGSYQEYSLQIGIRAPGVTAIDSNRLLYRGNVYFDSLSSIAGKTDGHTYRVRIYTI